eukprot:g772.t1 g772   contig10:701697-702974(+)
MVATHSWKAPTSPPPFTTTRGGYGLSSSATSSSSSSNQPSAGFTNAGSTATAPSSFRSPLGFGTGTSGYSTFIGGSGTNTDNMTNTTSTAATAAATGQVADFGSLLASSASLLSSMNRTSGGITPSASAGGQTTLREKSLMELSVASRRGNITGGTTTSASTTYEAEASAHRLFAREGFGFDSARLGRSARDLEMRAAAGGMMQEEKKDGGEPSSSSYQSTGETMGELLPSSAAALASLSNLQGASINQILSRHHEYCVRSALTTARELTLRQAEKRAEERLKNDWEEERSDILGRGVLGNRFMMGGGGGGGSRSGGGYGGMALENGVASRVLLLEGDSGVQSSSVSNIVPSPQALPSNIGGLVSSHLDAIGVHLKSMPSTSTAEGSVANAMALVTTLQEGLNDQSSIASLSAESMTGYSNTLAL